LPSFAEPGFAGIARDTTIVRHPVKAAADRGCRPWIDLNIDHFSPTSAWRHPRAGGAVQARCP
jgi:hypothetical protein